MKLNPEWLTERGLQEIFQTLTSAGFEAFAVGGCVRDAVRGVEANDIDIATNATPDQVKAALGAVKGMKLKPTGIDHGTWTVVVGKGVYEVTTYREDVATDGRRATVKFADSIEIDAKRRDFTMNALYMDKDGEVSDPTGRGIEDIENRLIRFVGDADDRCREDHLRILRMFRFRARFGFSVMDEGYVAADRNADGLRKVSAERKWAELEKVLSVHDPMPVIFRMQNLGILDKIVSQTTVPLLNAVVQAEHVNGMTPSVARRMAAFVPRDRLSELPLPKALQRQIETTLTLAKQDADVAVAVFQAENADIGVDAVLVASAARGHSPKINWNEVGRGASATLPVDAAVLTEKGIGTGKAMGDALQSARDLFIGSDLTMSRDDILSEILA